MRRSWWPSERPLTWRMTTLMARLILTRVLGQTITDRDLKTALLEGWPGVDLQQEESKDKGIKKIDTSSLEPIEFDTFIKIFRSKYKVPFDEDTIIEAFQVFDPENTGLMPANSFIKLMTTTGEVVPANDVEDLLLLANVDKDGNFDYTQLAKRLVEGPKNVRVL
ncbi:EF hand domain-containing calmodulin-like protein [Cryptosporidium canis]|uniref:EF hand domain-containing calmodulin-like protein n=1 Tax=Cryptosporidium canis TaxID=195482 RepID=A0ABQ8P4R7_9CRYT|nr:EF hand domain-containing calmodulin-like protein [Cryptosporidium canis]KAJ1612899.1 EF hand domain-containing calmodulin-like protein [Cryptosporidium canis]